MKAKPLDQWSVLRKKDEDQFYWELEEYANERGLSEIQFEELRDLLLEYIEASAFQFVKLPQILERKQSMVDK